VLSKRATPERLSAFSDAVFAVLITVLVLELRPPEHPTFTALLSLWPTWLSYAVSYLFIAIVWANHHHLMRYATETTYRLMWFNFAHLFSVSLLPLSTAWSDSYRHQSRLDTIPRGRACRHCTSRRRSALACKVECEMTAAASLARRGHLQKKPPGVDRGLAEHLPSQGDRR
jgi:hypothetical protein